MNPEPKDDNGFREWGRHILAEIERLNAKVEGLSEKMQQLLVKIATIEMRSKVWSGVVGVIGGSLAFLLALLAGLMRK